MKTIEVKTIPVTDEDAAEIVELLKDPEWPKRDPRKALWREAAVLSLMSGIFYRVWWTEHARYFIDIRAWVDRSRGGYLSAKDFFPGNY